MRLHNGARLRPEVELEVKPEFLETQNFVSHRRWREYWRTKRRENTLRPLRWIGRILILVFEAMFDGNRIVREVGPGKKPLERHEFERYYRDQQGGNF